MPTITSRPALGWDEIASGHKMVVDDNTTNITKSMDYTELKKLVGTFPTTSAAATLTLTNPGRYIHTGTGSTWTLPAGSAALNGLPFTFAHTGASGTVQINNSSAVAQIILDAGMKFDGFWDNDNSQWIIY